MNPFGERIGYLNKYFICYSLNSFTFMDLANEHLVGLDLLNTPLRSRRFE